MFASGLNNSNSTIDEHTINSFKSLERKSADPKLAEQASQWFLKASFIHEKATSTIAYIDSLKEQLKIEAGLTIKDGKKEFDEGNYQIVSEFFDTKGKARELRQRLLDFELDVMAVDPKIASTFKNLFSITIRLSDPSEKNKENFAETFFSNIPVVGGIAMLDKFQNDVRIMENHLINYCNSNV